ncbi:MAG: hypothetical protein ACAI34_24350 [Verrucomicrobium sp.]
MFTQFVKVFPRTAVIWLIMVAHGNLVGNEAHVGQWVNISDNGDKPAVMMNVSVQADSRLALELYLFQCDEDHRVRWLIKFPITILESTATQLTFEYSSQADLAQKTRERLTFEKSPSGEKVVGVVHELPSERETLRLDFWKVKLEKVGLGQ